ncbi:MAG TPA: class I SAM-dependent methyltransferase [Acidimicrobiales bacterium]
MPRGDDYDRRFEVLAAQGQAMHGEADLVESFTPTSVLDAGCGTGRVAIELRQRGCHVVGVDLDASMLERARQKAPDIEWVQADLADPGLSLADPFDLILLAGNVLIFVEPGTEGDVISNLTRHLAPGGLLVAGYSLRPAAFGVGEHDAAAERSGLTLLHRWSTWDRRPFEVDADYAVSVHQAPNVLHDPPSLTSGP